MREKNQRKKNFPETVTRSNNDMKMIITGLGIVALFILIGYISLESNMRETKPKNRGPVKDPKKFGLLEKNCSRHFLVSLALGVRLPPGQNAIAQCPEKRNILNLT
jgi:hypothetical protein